MVSELKSAGAVFKGSKTCTCPFHDDKHPSAEVKQNAEGTYHFICYVCVLFLDIFDIRAKRRGCDVGEVLKEVREEIQGDISHGPQVFPTMEAVVKSYSNVEAVYVYTNPKNRETELVVIRYLVEGKKRFAQCSPQHGGWVKSRPVGKMPLYNRCRIAPAEAVVVVEGEKAVHALTDIGIVATTAPMGAGKANQADWTPLTGKTVYLWPDNDPVDEKTGESTGEKHMREVQALLEPLGCKLHWLDNRLMNLPPKGDAVDFIKAQQGTKEEKAIAVKLILDEAQSIDVAGELEAKIARISKGEWRNIEWPWDELTYSAQALLPGTVTALCGDAGATKSFFILQAFWHWHVAGEKVALYELEDDRDYHLQRALAQLERESRLTESLWIQNNPAKAQAHFQNQRDVLSTFGRCLTACGDKMVTHKELLDWLEKQCQQGVSICGIDPITAAEPTGKPWIEDQKFIFTAKEIMRSYKSRLIYVIHPRVASGKLTPGLSSMAGGAAYPRFSHTVLWLAREEEGITNGPVLQNGQKQMGSYNRTLRISKARNGSGAGFALGFMFDSDSLCFRESGLLVPEAQSKKFSRKKKVDEEEENWND